MNLSATYQSHCWNRFGFAESTTRSLPMTDHLCMMQQYWGIWETCPDTGNQAFTHYHFIAVRANYSPILSFQFDHQNYHFIAIISCISTWGIISVSYAHNVRLLLAVLLTILARMDNRSPPKKNVNPFCKLVVGPLGMICIRASLSARPPLAAALHISRLEGFRTPFPCLWNEWVLGRPRFHQQQVLSCKYP